MSTGVIFFTVHLCPVSMSVIYFTIFVDVGNFLFDGGNLFVICVDLGYIFVITFGPVETAVKCW